MYVYVWCVCMMCVCMCVCVCDQLYLQYNIWQTITKDRPTKRWFYDNNYDILYSYYKILPSMAPSSWSSALVWRFSLIQALIKPSINVPCVKSHNQSTVPSHTISQLCQVTQSVNCAKSHNHSKLKVETCFFEARTTPAVNVVTLENFNYCYYMGTVILLYGNSNTSWLMLLTNLRQKKYALYILLHILLYLLTDRARLR